MLFRPRSNRLPLSLVFSLPSRQRRIRLPDWSGQLLRFSLVGVLNTVVDAVLYFVLSPWWGTLSFGKLLAKSVSYSAGVVNSYLWNKHWTFKSLVDSRRTFLPFVGVNLLAVGLNTGIMYLALEIFGWPESGALALATTATFMWNFAINKIFIFKQHGGRSISASGQPANTLLKGD